MEANRNWEMNRDGKTDDGRQIDNETKNKPKLRGTQQATGETTDEDMNGRE